MPEVSREVAAAGVAGFLTWIKNAFEQTPDTNSELLAATTDALNLFNEVIISYENEIRQLKEQ